MNVEDATDKKLNQQHMMEHLATGAVSLSRDSVPHFQNNDINDIDDQHQPPITMIQLSSYEDRDRGERGSGAGPRMLFDPKSGSMVAAPSREDTNTGGKGGRKERIKQKKIGPIVTIARKIHMILLFQYKLLLYPKGQTVIVIVVTMEIMVFRLFVGQMERMIRVQWRL
mmetsp:Transcript_26975/g.34358  ORF Transcript_26975/g.34358 Transcript_26975/m.34358 type:complete len:169 (+) Transcript_26975:1426-1932(+)